MKLRFILSLSFVFIFAACQNSNGNKIVLNVGGVEITADEFESSFQRSAYAKNDTSSSRADFLEAYIMRILILQEAEREGLDKDPRFLGDVENFWQSSLLKLALDKKMQDIASKTSISEDEIKRYYAQHKESDFSGKELAEVSDTIKWVLLRLRQEESLTEWIGELKAKTDIKVEHKALGLKK